MLFHDRPLSEALYCVHYYVYRMLYHIIWYIYYVYKSVIHNIYYVLGAITVIPFSMSGRLENRLSASCITIFIFGMFVGVNY